MADERWLPGPRRAGRGRPVVCFAPAGAGAGFFRDWAAGLADGRLIPVQLPGREERFGEPAMDDAKAIAGAVAAAIAADAEARTAPVLLGVSYGALLAFETAHALESAGRAVGTIVACARGAPQEAPRPSPADRDNAALLDYVVALGGPAAEVLREDGLAEIVLPAMRADFRANDRYATPRGRTVAASLTAVVGEGDTAVRSLAGATLYPDWQARTRGAFRAEDVPGGHFFVHDAPEAGFAALRRAVRAPVPA